jgi:hypothetical protein
MTADSDSVIVQTVLAIQNNNCYDFEDCRGLIV